MKISVKNLANEIVREMDLPEGVFGYPYKADLIHASVVAVQAAQRSGTHKTKTRSEVSGSGRKPWRQKGTGRARAGDIRTPLWRKGGIVHGPQPRSYVSGLSRREKRNALKSALSRKLHDEAIVVLEGLELDTHRTAELVAVMNRLGVDGKALVVDRGDNQKLDLASRNNPHLKVVDALSVNVYDIVDRPFLVTSEAALGRLIEVLSK